VIVLHVSVSTPPPEPKPVKRESPRDWLRRLARQKRGDERQRAETGG
jgi:hypothetical protein